MRMLLVLSVFAGAAFAQQCTGAPPSKPASMARCSDSRPACECDTTGSCKWAWTCLKLAKPIESKAPSPVSLNRQPPAPAGSAEPRPQDIQNLKPRNQPVQQPLLEPPASAPASEDAAGRLQKQEEQTAEIIQLLQRIAVATETIARGVDQQHK